MTELNQIDLRALVAGNKRTWDSFVAAAAPLINAVVRRSLASYRLSEDDVLDAAQDVFVRLCANDFRLLKTFDPARAPIVLLKPQGLAHLLACSRQTVWVFAAKTEAQRLPELASLQPFAARGDYAVWRRPALSAPSERGDWGS